MSSVPTGGSVRCACCNAAFHRLSSHLSWNARCAAFYDSLPSDMVNGVLDDVHRPDAAHFNEECDTAGAGESRKILGVLQQLTNQLMTITMKGLMTTLV